VPTPPLSEEICQEALEAVARHNGNVSAAAESLGINRATFNGRLNVARARQSGMIVTRRSTLYRDGEPILEWERTDLDRQKAQEAQQAAYLALSAKLPRIARYHG
jgi:transposase-like protein